MTGRLGIDSLTVFGMPPLDYVAMVADLGCSHITTGLGPVPWKLDCFPSWSLRDDPGLRREVIAAMRDRGVALGLGDGFVARPDADMRDRTPDLDLLAELGAERVSAISMEPDHPHALDQLAVLAELAAVRGMGLLLEFAPPHPVINSLDMAVATLRQIAAPNARLVIDAMHFFRTGASVPDLADLDPDLIGHVQLCDVPLRPLDDNYFREACFNRLCPGDGELPLRDLVGSIPDTVSIGLEVPMRSRMETADDVRREAARMVAAARLLIDGTGT